MKTIAQTLLILTGCLLIIIKRLFHSIKRSIFLYKIKHSKITECFYDFTKEKYAIKDKDGKLVGWKNLIKNRSNAIISNSIIDTNFNIFNIF